MSSVNNPHLAPLFVLPRGLSPSLETHIVAQHTLRQPSNNSVARIYRFLHYLRCSPQALLVGCFMCRNRYKNNYDSTLQCFIDAATRYDANYGCTVAVSYVLKVFQRAEDLIHRYDKWRSDHNTKGTATELLEYLIAVTIHDEMRIFKPPHTVVDNFIQVEQTLSDFGDLSVNIFFELYVHAKELHSKLQMGDSQPLDWLDTPWVMLCRILDEHMSDNDFINIYSDLAEEDLLETVFEYVKHEATAYLMADTLWECRSQGPPEFYSSDDPVPPPPHSLFGRWWTTPQPSGGVADPLEVLGPLLERSHCVDNVKNRKRRTRGL